MSGFVTPVGSITQFARGFLPGLFTVNPRLILVPIDDPTTGEQLKNPEGKDLFQLVNKYVALSEDHYDEMVVTEHPVEQGAVINDHAYKLPARLTMEIGWTPSNAGATNVPFAQAFGVSLPTLIGGLPPFIGAGSTYIKAIYNRLLEVQASASLLTIYTGKRVYNNMLTATLQVSTTRETENSLMVIASFKEIIRVATHIVNSSGVSTDPNALSDPLSSLPTTQRGPQNPANAPNFNPSALPVGVGDVIPGT